MKRVVFDVSNHGVIYEPCASRRFLSGPILALSLVISPFSRISGSPFRFLGDSRLVAGMLFRLN